MTPQKEGESNWGKAGAAGARRKGPTLLSWTMRSRWADRDPVLLAEKAGDGRSRETTRPEEKGGKARVGWVGVVLHRNVPSSGGVCVLSIKKTYGGGLV